MRRGWWWLWTVLLLALAAGLLLYQRQQEVSRLGQSVYYELEGDSFPPLPGVLDDPVFAQLPPPPPDRPVSWGRYRPAPASQTTPASGNRPESRAAVASSKASSAETKDSPQPHGELPAAGTSNINSAQPATAAASAAQSAARTPRDTGSVQRPQTSAAETERAVSGQAPAGPAPAAGVAPTDFTQRLQTNVKLHILLMGNDQPQLGSGRADVLVVLTFDPVAQQLTFLSIPRDTRVQIPEHEVSKINAAYALGGPTLQTLAVEHFLGIPMDKFVEVSMDGFKRAIDLVGGVQVNPPFAFELDGQQFTPGPVRLNGEQALAYTRMRKQDPRGDLGRNQRQQEVIRSLMTALGSRSPEELQALLPQLQSQVRTNFSPSEVVALRRTQAYALQHQSTLKPAGENRRIEGLWYYLVSDQERQRLHLLLR
ncbi:LCP family protein [Deinococcus sp. Marseille-Q6407]|uniref:LCP family protein n=1 Tax=Deinococcus sp. Marseille-Q6407 TaxID=2969223 RepID=UPI0021BE2D1D|nr:LCP family protein [Deinococcus sp. Marseille-Q6407]